MPSSHDTDSGPSILDPRVTRWAMAALLILAISRLAFHLFAGPLPDEAYYWLWGQHPALSYFDHPPLQAWMQAGTAALFGDSLLALRLPSLLTTAWIVGILWWWARRARAELPGLPAHVVVAAFFCSPMLFIYTMIVFNDHLMVALLLSASVLFVTVFHRLSRDGKIEAASLYGAGLAIGLAALTKYNAALFGLGIAVTIVATPRYRPLLRSPHLYLAALIGSACLIPVAIWNLDNDGASFQYNLVDRISASEPLSSRLEHLATLGLVTILTLSPFLAGAVAAALRRRQVTSFLQDWRALALGTTLTSAIILLVLSQFTAVLFYWTIVAWVAVVPLAALQINRRWVFAGLFISGMAVAALYTINYAVLPLSALFGPADDESAIVYGWRDTAADIQAARQSTGADFLLATDYRAGSILAFWSGDRDVEVIAQRHSQFDFWFDEALRAGQDALIVSDTRFPLTGVVRQQFASIEEAGTIAVTRFGFHIHDYTLHIGRGYIPRPTAN